MTEAAYRFEDGWLGRTLARLHALGLGFKSGIDMWWPLKGIDPVAGPFHSHAEFDAWLGAVEGLDVARGPDQTGWHCNCGKSGLVIGDDQGCDDPCCPVRKVLP